MTKTPKGGKSLEPVDLRLSEGDLLWLEGIIEGEGSISLDRRPATKYEVSTSPPAPYLCITMTDKDVVNRIGFLLNMKTRLLNRKTTAGKSEYRVRAGRRQTLIHLFPLLLPHMGIRRKDKMQEAIDALDAWKVWYANGGRSKMSKRGYDASLGKK